jgi:hypothetical protein
MALVWSPLISSVTALLDSGDSIALLIAPFIKLDALRVLMESNRITSKLRVIIRLKPEDLLSGASDLSIYPFLRERGVPVFYNHSIHLKLFVFESNRCLVTSSNITQRGLGLAHSANVEAGALVQLDIADWNQIYSLINESRLFDDQLYDRLKRFVSDAPPASTSPVFEWPDEEPKSFTISSLPATEDVESLFRAYFCDTLDSYSKEEVRRIAHDLAIFHIPSGLSRMALEQQLGDSFCNSPFVSEFISFLKMEGSLRFGAVNDWIHRWCEDVPLPYRWELKENTRIFYNWLAHFIPEITWDRPNHSQVIYWNKGNP